MQIYFLVINNATSLATHNSYKGEVAAKEANGTISIYPSASIAETPLVSGCYMIH